MQADEEHVNLQSERDQVGPGGINLINIIKRDSAHSSHAISPPCPAADSAAEDGQEADGRGRRGDRAAGARQEEAAAGSGRAD